MATKAKRTYKCGGCGDMGHNKRTCPNKGATAVAAAAKAAEVVTPKPTPVVETVAPAPSVSAPVAIDGNSDLVGGHRKPNTRPVAPAAPYDCPTCDRVGILALCELEGGAVALRCEHCMNKSPLKSILKWGAFPEDKPTGQRGKAADGRLFSR